MTTMASVTRLLALAATAQAAVTGWNYGNMNGDNSARTEEQFKKYFQIAIDLPGFPNSNSARLYTMIQGGTKDDPISAIQAAIDTNTTLLLGLWTSGDGFDNEISALKKSIEKYGDKLADLTVGISVGSEDLYRYSSEAAGSNGIGIGPKELVEKIQKTKEALKGTALEKAKIGHVDTWTAFTNGTNAEVIENIDWLGFDGYPYWENKVDNSVENAKELFDKSVAKTKAVAGDKEVWITETGWPVSGDTENKAEANVESAKKFWDAVGCELFGKVNVWWYILSDEKATPSFSILEHLEKSEPLFNLTCPATSSSDSNNSSSTSTTLSPTASSTSGSDSGSGSGSGSGSDSGDASTTGSDASSPSGESSARINTASFAAVVLGLGMAIMAL